MIKLQQFMSGTGPKSASKYYASHLSASSYYRNGVGILQGQTFEHLGLSKRDVDEHAFSSIEHNINPETGKRITCRTRKVNRRSGMDLTLIPSKTLSMVIAENPGEFGETIEKACIAAKDKAMEFAGSLVRVSNANSIAFDERFSRNALYMSVVHREARATRQHAADPYWHAHSFIFPVTYDPLMKRLMAASMSHVLKFSETIDAIFISELERRLTEMGIRTERTADGKGFEVTNVKGREVFCKRTSEILHQVKQVEKLLDCLARAKVREAAKLGKLLDYTKERNKIVNARSRELAKEKAPITADEQLAIWRSQMTPEIRESLQKEAVLSGERRNWRTPEQAKEEIVFSAFKQESVVHEFKIVELLLRATGGAMTFDEALEFARSDTFLKLDKEGHVTTEAVRQEERQMLKSAKEAQDRCLPLIPDPARAIQDQRVANAPDQAAATKFIWNSRDGVMDISGIAGAGKSTALKEIIPAIREAGHQIVILAPTSASEKNLHPDFPEAKTLQQFMVDQEVMPGIARNLVIFLDESSLVSVPQMAKLVELVRTQGCRLITLGDVDQHRSPQRGDAIRILQESKSVRSSELTETYRAQVAYLKETILDLKAGGIRREIGYDRLDEHGDIREVEDTSGMRDAAVQAHLEAVRKGDLAILASPTHFEARAAAEMVRNILKGEGKIEPEDHTITRISRLRVEGKELRDPIHYQPGRVIAFHTKTRTGFMPGTKWQVVENQADGLIKVQREGVTKLFNPKHEGRLEDLRDGGNNPERWRPGANHGGLHPEQDSLPQQRYSPDQGNRRQANHSGRRALDGSRFRSS
jgi:conjugative relaxase-like TrwC/TraI family protein